jgi:hypothetical protein
MRPFASAEPRAYYRLVPLCDVLQLALERRQCHETTAVRVQRERAAKLVTRERPLPPERVLRLVLPRAVDILRYKPQKNLRASALSLLENAYLHLGEKQRALRCFEASIDILRRLERTPETLESIGKLHIWSRAIGESGFDFHKWSKHANLR